MVVRDVGQLCVGRVVTAATVTLSLMMAVSPAHARGRHYFHRHAYSQHVAHSARVAFGNNAPNFSAIVIDANSGRTLYGVNEDAPRHPASITKVMTLYLLFEQLEKGRMSLDTSLQVSAHAAGQSPTKLGVPAGSTVSVDTAIKAIVTRSANDMAVTVAENLAGDEITFARLMTEKAHSLGMNHTFYHNASGLPDMRQITTARDLTILGRAIHDRFPHYYKFFSTPSFVYRGQVITSHNHLMARMSGMDGIKTGYTNASGFNLLSSIQRGGRHVVAVVMGGKSAAGRDNIMEGLLESHFEEAAATPATHVAQGSNVEQATETPHEAAPEPQPVERDLPRGRVEVAQADDDSEDGAPVERQPPHGPSLIAPEMAVPMPDRPVEHVHLAASRAEIPKAPPAHATDDKPRPAFIAGAPKSIERSRLPGSLGAGERGKQAADGSTSRRTLVASTNTTTVATATPSSLHWVTGAPPARLGPGAAPEGKVTAASSAQPITPAASGDKSGSDKTGSVADARNPRGEKAHEEAHTPVKGEWIIQIGATDNAGAAAELLTRARSEGRSALASAKPFTEKVQKGEATLYRARFAGLDPSEAETACKTLKRSGFACFTTRN
jgi:D-alanyl-D-alanine carboxypeptidase